MAIVLNHKMHLAEVLYRETYDRIAIFPDGSWAHLTSNTTHSKAYRYINRSQFFNKTRQQIRELLIELEVSLALHAMGEE